MIRDIPYSGQTAFSDEGQRCAYRSPQGGIVLMNITTEDEVVREELGPIHSSLQELTLSSDGSRLASLHGDTTICLWDAFSGAYLSSLTPSGDGNSWAGERYGIRFSGDGRHVIFRFGSYEAERSSYWDTESGEEVLGLPPGERRMVLNDGWIYEREGIRSRRVIWVPAANRPLDKQLSYTPDGLIVMLSPAERGMFTLVDARKVLARMRT
jgi:WD40 repeat protein